VNGVGIGVGVGDRPLDRVEGRARASAQARPVRRRRQHVPGQQQLDRQQVLEQPQRGVGLAHAERRAGAVVLDAEVQRRRVEARGRRELLELAEQGRGRIAQLQAVGHRGWRAARRPPEEGVPQVAHPAFAQQPDLGQGDPQRVVRDR